MEIDEAKGLVIFAGTFALYAFVIIGCMERRLKHLDRVVKQIEQDTKYVN
jgi:hypothetical protein